MTITRGELAAELADSHDITNEAARQAIDAYAEQLAELDHTTIGDELTGEQADDIRRALAAQEAVDTGDLLVDVYEATEVKRAAAETATDADREWRAAIRAALASGQRVADVADAAGISRERVYQIRDGRR